MLNNQGAGQRLVRGGLELDLERWTVRVHWREVELSYRQFELLHHLMKSPGRVWTRAQLIEALWDPRPGDDIRPEVVDVLVCRVRKKLGGAARLIETVKFIGYRFKNVGA